MPAKKRTARKKPTPPAGGHPAGAVRVDAGGRPVVDDDGRPVTDGTVATTETVKADKDTE